MNVIENIRQQNAANSAIVLAKVMVNVQKGMPLDIAYDLVFGSGTYKKLADEIWEAANAS